jgi:lysozyme
MPPGLNVVVDLSHYNSSVDFGALAAGGIAGVIHKATQGTSETDPTYAQRRGAALAAGLLWGAYHFGTGDDGVTQAQHFLDVAQPDAGTLLVLDFEENPGGSSMSLDQARDFVTHVESLTGRAPGLYAGAYLKQLLGQQSDPVLAKCWFWLSEYGSTPVVPANWSTWTMWQYTDGSVGPEPHEAGGVGACDRDTFNGDLSRLHALWGA